MTDVFVPHGYASKSFWPPRREDSIKVNKTENQGLVEIQPFSKYQLDHPHVIRKRYGHLGASPRCRASGSDSMDLLRKVVQPAINTDILDVFKKYVLVFRNAAQNVTENMTTEPFASYTNQNDSIDSLTYKACCDALDHCKTLFDTKKSVKKDVKVENHGASNKLPRSSVASSLPGHLITMKRVPSPDFPWNKRIGKGSPRRSLSPIPRKKGRPTPNKRYGSPQRILHRDWNPARLTTDTKFVMGTKANKALGLGATRGRIYMKHPDLFKYSSDPEDKKWMIKNSCMVATGGKNTFIMIADDIYDLLDNEYKDSSGLMLNEMQLFTLPEFVLQKMRALMVREKKLSEKLMGKTVPTAPALAKSEPKIKTEWEQMGAPNRPLHPQPEKPSYTTNQSSPHSKRSAAERAAAAITATSEGEMDSDTLIGHDRSHSSDDSNSSSGR